MLWNGNFSTCRKKQKNKIQQKNFHFNKVNGFELMKKKKKPKSELFNSRHQISETKVYCEKKYIVVQCQLYIAVKPTNHQYMEQRKKTGTEQCSVEIYWFDTFFCVILSHCFPQLLRIYIVKQLRHFISMPTEKFSMFFANHSSWKKKCYKNIYKMIS